MVCEIKEREDSSKGVPSSLCPSLKERICFLLSLADSGVHRVRLHPPPIEKGDKLMPIPSQH